METVAKDDDLEIKEEAAETEGPKKAKIVQTFRTKPLLPNPD
jgi:hypothetical protein